MIQIEPVFGLQKISARTERERERERLADDFAVPANIARAMPKVLPLRLVDIVKND